jgi:alpha-1,3-glucan synthase
MAKYPGRVCSKPVFTALPECIFSGAEFALIPSRDEPFGLVAVMFGRKGALGVGARVGGLGQMPGWWFTIKSTTTEHLLDQFKMAVRGALASKSEMRKKMRACSSLQRFPVSQWIEDLEILQSTAIHPSRSGRALREDRQFAYGSEHFCLGFPFRHVRICCGHTQIRFSSKRTIPSRYNSLFDLIDNCEYPDCSCFSPTVRHVI